MICIWVLGGGAGRMGIREERSSFLEDGAGRTVEGTVGWTLAKG